MQSVKYVDLQKLLDILQNMSMWYKRKIFQKIFLENPNFFLHNIYLVFWFI